MKQAEIKMLFDAGGVQNPVIAHTVMNDKWMMMVDIKKRDKKEVTTTVLESKRGKTREFSTVEAAVKLLNEIGFRELTVRIA